jgi:hypothetical protein
VKPKRYTVIAHNAILPKGKVVYQHHKQDLEGFIAITQNACGKGTAFYMYYDDIFEWPYDELDED